MGFKDRLKEYNASKATTVALNPHEASEVLATQTAPEVENAPKAVASAVETAPSSTTAPTSTSPQEPPKRTRRTKAEMEAARAAEQVGASTTPSSVGSSVAAAQPATGDLSGFTIEELVAELRGRGLAVIATQQY